MPEPNLDEIDRAIKEAEAHPERHMQDAWIAETECGTAACVAGFCVLLNGWLPRRGRGTVVSDDMVAFDEVVHPTTGRARSVWGVAQDIMGLTSTQSNALFCASNTVDDLKLIRNQIAFGADSTDALLEGVSWQ